MRPKTFCKSLILMVWMLFPGIVLFAQSGFPGYYRWIALTQKADSLYKAGSYKEAALTYTMAFQTKVEKGIPVDRVTLKLNEACCWSLAGDASQAFSCLEEAILEDFSDAGYLEGEKDFSFLHTNPAWAEILKKVTDRQIRKEKLAAIQAERTTFTGDSSVIYFMPLSKNVKELIESDSLPFLSVNSMNFRIYFKGNSYAARHLAEVQELIRLSYKKVLKVMGTDFYEKGIQIILVDSREELKEVTGIAAYGGFALVGDYTVFLVYNDHRRIQATHELFHLLSQDIWGITYSRLLDEGGAVYADNECFGSGNIAGINHGLADHARLVPLKMLISSFDEEAKKNDVIAYFESAGIFQYLLENYGIEKIKRLRIEGFDNFEKIFNFSVDSLENDWLQFIKNQPVPDGIPWDKFLKEGCG